MSQDIGNSSNLQTRVRAISFSGGSFGVAGGLVLLAEIDGEHAEDFAGGRADDGHVKVLDEEFDVASGVGSSDADAAEFAVDAACDDAGVVNAVGANLVVGGALLSAARAGLDAGRVASGWGGSVREGSVWPVRVVVVPEPVDHVMELGERGALFGLRTEPFLEGLVEATDFALGLRVVGVLVLLGDVASVEFVFEAVAYT